jgi:hypothetical protein
MVPKQAAPQVSAAIRNARQLFFLFTLASLKCAMTYQSV